MKSYPELYGDFMAKLNTKLSPKDARSALDRVVDGANSLTCELSEARTQAFITYLKLSNDFKDQWLKAWIVNRDLTLAAEGIE